MKYKSKRNVIFLVLLIFLFGGLGFTKSKFNDFKKVIVPSSVLKVGTDTFMIDDQCLYKITNSGKDKSRFLEKNVDSIGILLFENRLYYINKADRYLCSVNLKGEDLRVIDKCNILVPYQTFYKLGLHVYYYDTKDHLNRIDSMGNIDCINEN